MNVKNIVKANKKGIIKKGLLVLGTIAGLVIVGGMVANKGNKEAVAGTSVEETSEDVEKTEE